VTLPKYPVNGSHFGTCTCGATQTNAVPCEHMSVVALSAIIRPQISPMNIMPIWWKRSQWRLQFLLETCPKAKITIKSVKEGWLPDYSLRLCPDWTTGSKPGCPKKGERIKSGLETAMAKGKGGTARTKATTRRRCDVCGVYGHMYEDCFLLEKSEEIVSMQGYMFFRLKTSSWATMIGPPPPKNVGRLIYEYVDCLRYIR